MAVIWIFNPIFIELCYLQKLRIYVYFADLTKRFHRFLGHLKVFEKNIQLEMINLQADPQSFQILFLGIDQITNHLSPPVDSASIYGIFAYKKYLFLFFFELSTDNGIVERFNVFVVSVFDESLIVNLFRQ